MAQAGSNQTEQKTDSSEIFTRNRTKYSINKKAFTFMSSVDVIFKLISPSRKPSQLSFKRTSLQTLKCCLKKIPF